MLYRRLTVNPVSAARNTAAWYTAARYRDCADALLDSAGLLPAGTR